MMAAMKPLLFLLSGFLLSSCAQEIGESRVLIKDGITYHQESNEPVTGIVESFYPTGQLRTRTAYKNGKKEGLDELFHQNGQLSLRVNRENGLKEGLYEGFYRNGQLSYRWHFKVGAPDGVWETFDEDGKLMKTQTFKDVIPQ